MTSVLSISVLQATNYTLGQATKFIQEAIDT